jgi:type VI secretion system protein ImpI
VHPDALLQRDPGEVAEEIGAVLRVMVDELGQLLRARAAAKVLAKSNSRTMIGREGNNPLKFMPSAEEVLETMFARRRPGYLGGQESVEAAFRDLKSHEFATYAAMQKALAKLLDDLSPEAIEKKVASSAFSSKKARAWDTFVQNWEAKAEAHENGMLDVFLTYFADAYEKASKGK